MTDFDRRLAEVAAAVRAAWSPVPVPHVEDLFEGPPACEEIEHLEVFGGRHFDEVDCSELRTSAWTWLSYFKFPGRAYYTATLILCQVERFMLEPDDEFGYDLLTNLIKVLSQPWLFEGKTWTMYSQAQIQAIIRFLEVVMDWPQTQRDDRDDLEGITAQWKFVAGMS